MVKVRKGEAAPYEEFAKVPAPECKPGEQFSHTVTGLPVGTQVGFIVVSVLEGSPGVESKPLQKSADGKHMLVVLAPKGADADAKGAKGGAPAKKPAAKIVAKTGGMTTQWDILRSMGL